MRHCGDCTLCCKLLPMQRGSYPQARVDAATDGLVQIGFFKPADVLNMIPDFDKAAGAPCPHQRHGKGCAIYSRRPFGCRVWNCRWLVNDDTADLRRPDRARYVVDMMPDFVTITDESNAPINVQVVSIWVDPAAPEAWRDPGLLAYLERRGKEGIAALIRFNESGGFVVFPPAMSSDGQWHELQGQHRPQHIGDELIAGLAASRPVTLQVPE